MQQVPEPGSTPLPRIGDAERDAAASRLQTAMAEGRLTTDEFNERLDAALRARTEADLAPLFADLPSPAANPQAVAVPPAMSAGPASTVPSGATATGVGRRRPSPLLLRVYGAVWPLTLLALFATHWRFWWLIFVPMVLGPIVFGTARNGNPRAQQLRDQHLQDRMDRRLDRMDRRAQRFERRTVQRLQQQEEQRQLRG